MASSMHKAVVVVPNWNGQDQLLACLDSLRAQSLKAHIIVVDNGSTDGSRDLLAGYEGIEIILHDDNRGYAGGVNPGFKRAIELGADYVAPFNNDAVADKHWLKNLADYLDAHEEAGVAACKLLSADGKRLDSTGDYYTVWGLPYPRGRGETETDKYDDQLKIFGASGGASLYRVALLKEVGLLDESFFAYYEDVDISFRAQLAGWEIAYVPAAEAYHQIGATSGKMAGFTTYQTMKNLPLLFIKNVPRRYLYRIGWRLALANWLFFVRALSRGQGWKAFQGGIKSLYLTPGALRHRYAIQTTKKVSDDYIWSVLVHDLPPNARALRKLRARWHKLTGRR